MRSCPTCNGTFEGRRLICPTDGDLLIYGGKTVPESGQVLSGRYRLGNLLGEGGMGKVFEAVRTDSGEVVAVKVLKVGGSGDEKDRRLAERRFRVEAEAAAALDHPGVVKVHEFGQTPEGTCFIAMERLRGATFDEMRRAGKLGSPERVVELLREVCEVLAAAHRKGIVHRDLKPSNIFLHRESRDRSRVKVLDFGIAKILDRAGEHLTSTGEFLGTLLYMSPEQTSGAAVTPAVDVYSLGVILFEALTGALPFAARTPFELLRLHATSPAPSLSTLRADVSDELDLLVARCLLKRPENRFGHAGDLAQALAGIRALRDDGGPSSEATRRVPRDASSMVGLILDDRYEIQEWVAPSRFGSDVYRATHLRTDSDVAVRLWRTEKGEVRDCLIDAFRHEAKAMGVRHPNLIAVIDLGYDDECVYIVTELVESISLRTFLERKGPLESSIAVPLVHGVAEALHALHGKGIISGGMSPETLRVTTARDAPVRLLLTPLGLSGPKGINLLVAPGSGLRGDRSLEYISPEQRGGRDPDARSDLFSLSLVLLEMLGGSVAGWVGSMAPTRATGKAPPAGAPADPSRAVPPALGAPWREFFLRALAGDPDRRFPSAGDFIAAMPGVEAAGK
jgi:serine/threonine protein kinase